MKEDITIAKSNIIQLQQENCALRAEKEALLDEHKKQLRVSLLYYTFRFTCNLNVSNIHCDLWSYNNVMT